PVNRFGGYHVGGAATGLATAHRHHHGAACSTHGPQLPPAMPDWSPVNRFGGYHVGGAATGLATAHRHHHGAACSTHG
ncbi:hypothetical protein C7E25_24285, partial [Stenotrophomonas maltophilia]